MNHCSPKHSKPGLPASVTTISKPHFASILDHFKPNKNKNKNKNKKFAKNSNNKKRKKSKSKSSRKSSKSSLSHSRASISRSKSRSVLHQSPPSRSKSKPYNANSTSRTKKVELDTIDLSNSSDGMTPFQTVEQTLESKGFAVTKKIADTLQGTIWKAKVIGDDDDSKSAGENVVIKVTRKDLHFKSVTLMANGKTKKIQEDIIKESDMLRELTANNPPDSLTRFIDFFEDSNHYFLVMEDGGSDLFEYVVKCHNLLRRGKLGRKEWRLTAKKIFSQMVEFLDWLHNDMHCAHLDISLENMLICNANIYRNIHTGEITLSKDFQIKVCDFGLSEKFSEKSDFGCRKYVGKTRYKSPELWTKQREFNALSNDVWGLGVSLFMMVMGAPPFKYPDMNDANFKLVINSQILELIQSWNRAKYMTPQILELLHSMLTTEDERLTMREVKEHSWVK